MPDLCTVRAALALAALRERVDDALVVGDDDLLPALLARARRLSSHRGRRWPAPGSGGPRCAAGAWVLVVTGVTVEPELVGRALAAAPPCRGPAGAAAVAL